MDWRHLTNTFELLLERYNWKPDVRALLENAFAHSRAGEAPFMEAAENAAAVAPPEGRDAAFERALYETD